MIGRKLFIVSRDDPQADGSPRLIKIREQYEKAPPPKQLLILDGSAMPSLSSRLSRESV
jgi:hypothetical protein